MKLLLLLLAGLASAEEKTLPYLGPGSDKLSKQEYERIYKNYIQTSVLLGYPFLEGAPQACDQALGAVFRQAGFFAYPVPAEAPQVSRSVKTITGKKVESYELGGMLVQVVRDSSGALERLVWINSGAPKATRRLSQTIKKEILTLEKDPITGLERVKGLPVGYPNPFLNAAGQGLFVKILKFNGKKEGCQPLEFFDNAWNGGFELDNTRCVDLNSDAQRVWSEAISPAEFRDRELNRMKDRALKNAMAQGVKEEEAKKLVAKHFVPPYTNEINVVGSAMRNLAQCNMLSLGTKEPRKAAPDGGKPSLTDPESGSAR